MKHKQKQLCGLNYFLYIRHLDIKCDVHLLMIYNTIITDSLRNIFHDAKAALYREHLNITYLTACLNPLSHSNIYPYNRMNVIYLLITCIFISKRPIICSTK